MIKAPPNSFQAETREQWRSWLRDNHRRTEGIWLVTFKKSSGKPHLPYEDFVEEALCFGWIDSKANALDEQRSMIWMAPRKPRTGWSKPNKERVERLLKNGLMTPAGLTKIEAAKRDGSWTKLDAVERLEIPKDLAGAFRRHKGSKANFDAFPPSTRKGILGWIESAKREETRAKRVEETAALAAKNERANEWKPKK